MRRPGSDLRLKAPSWSAWLLVILLAAVSAYLKFNRDASPLIYLPLVTVPALVVGYVFGGMPPESAEPESVEPETRTVDAPDAPDEPGPVRE